MIGALILTGGAASRMGRDKAELDVCGRRAVDRLLQLCFVSGATAVFTIGGKGYGYLHIDDPVPLGGPVGGIIAGAGTLRRRGCKTALVLAVDAPTLQSQDLKPLFDLAEGAAYEGYPFPFVAPLGGLPADAPADWAVGRLLDAWGVTRLPAPVHAIQRLRGANTPEEFEALVEAFRGLEGTG
ncbi:NTP transferase domain-containing protein [Phenylobacterium sp.]|uniref:molybdenum cofactor guanylyltransferase n=1 Tax=Phenylobacterium sp. TaxID=1871053 RepID=UPI0011F947CB|nr:NTP transferase domain-containing protein [Phenylobacterium sp.]THD58111.1 MAG: molybdenum cofactor guanylyltransferase [Phenylobacterium sp.]